MCSSLKFLACDGHENKLGMPLQYMVFLVTFYYPLLSACNHDIFYIKRSRSITIIYSQSQSEQSIAVRVCLFTGLEPVTGALEWSTGVEYWSGLLEWCLLVLLHSSWWVKPTSLGVLRLFWITYVYNMFLHITMLKYSRSRLS